jgi:hypothetical protein
MKSPIRSEFNPWKKAIVERLIVTGIYRKDLEDDPMKALLTLEAWNWQAGQVMERAEWLEKIA